jgi:inorganic pyrophosphatase
MPRVKKDKIYSVHVEIEKHSNQKYEFDKESDKFILDRVLPYPYFYPYAYGYFKNTLGNDGDELDALIITDVTYRIDQFVDCLIVGGLVMEDEKGMDEKIFVVPINDKKYINMNEEEKNNIHNDIIWFFSNYKSKEKNRWSKVHNLMTKEEAIKLYDESVKNFKKK